MVENNLRGTPVRSKTSKGVHQQKENKNSKEDNQLGWKLVSGIPVKDKINKGEIL